MTDATRVGVASVGRSRAERAYASPPLVEAAVREALLAAGLGRARPDVPLADVIAPGASVLLKPNWVHHRNRSGQGMDCMVTHPVFVLAALKEVVAARPGKVLIVDAPVQGAEFDALTPESWRRQVREIAGDVPVEIHDLRQYVSHRDERGLNLAGTRRDAGGTVEFDLARESLLEPVSGSSRRFRVTCYDPRHMAGVQRPGVHRYLLSVRPFEADVVINLPKLKTHKKAGVTAALKNLVGINADKNYLPHHRLGGSALGGDCYPGASPLKLLAEVCLDQANERIGARGYNTWKRLSDALLVPDVVLGKLRGRPPNLEGSWHGNDTVWRMVLDLNRLLRYGRADGTIAATPQRCWLSLTDGIVAGEGEGPMSPAPLPLGVVTCASNPAAADVVHAALLRFDWECVPVIRGAFQPMPLPLVEARADQTWASCGGRSFTMRDIGEELGADARPPKGWQGRIEAPTRARPARRVG